MNDPHPRIRIFGALLQGLVLGGLVLASIFKLIQAASHASVFRYEGF